MIEILIRVGLFLIGWSSGFALLLILYVCWALWRDSSSTGI